MRSTLISTVGIAFLFLTTLTGCGSSNELGTVAAGGTVRYQGEPLAGATVTFIPQSGQRPAVGLTDESGNFQVTTLTTRDGALPGPYKVTVTKTDEAVAPKNMQEMSVEEMRAYESEMMKGPPVSKDPTHLLPVKYKSADTTPFTCEVEAAGGNKFEFELTD
ncbi:MAG: carboxypeptidase-like regulatory domain-containing protein [Pirellulaceae bacterium]